MTWTSRFLPAGWKRQHHDGVIGLTDTLGQQVVGSYTRTFNEHTLNNSSLDTRGVRSSVGVCC
jgi:hypothetical protein